MILLYTALAALGATLLIYLFWVAHYTVKNNRMKKELSGLPYRKFSFKRLFIFTGVVILLFVWKYVIFITAILTVTTLSIFVVLTLSGLMTLVLIAPILLFVWLADSYIPPKNQGWLDNEVTFNLVFGIIAIVFLISFTTIAYSSQADSAQPYLEDGLYWLLTTLNL